MELVAITQELERTNKIIDQEKQELKKIIDQEKQELKSWAIQFPTAEMKYRKALARKKAELEDAGRKITLIDDIAKGDDEVSNLKFERDYAEKMYEALKESIRASQTQVSSLQSILKYQSET